MNHDKIKMREKLSYAAVNFGNIPIMTLINGYLLIFYTNICGLSPAACATLFLIARILGRLNDPLVGFVIDHLPEYKAWTFPAKSDCRDCFVQSKLPHAVVRTNACTGWKADYRIHFLSVAWRTVPCNGHFFK